MNSKKQEVIPPYAKSLDQVYFERNQLAQLVARMAGYLGWTATWRPSDAESSGWPTLFVQLPTGQISYHIPQVEATVPLTWRPVAWDGHDDAEKYRRIDAFVKEGFSARREE